MKRRVAFDPVGQIGFRNARDTALGFSMVEFVLASMILMGICGYIFSSVVNMQRTSAHQTQVLAVQDNMRIAMQTLERYIRHAGNDPRGSGLVGVTIISPTEVRLCSDLTGSAVGPDKGDPDGDIGETDEDVTIRYNAASQSIEIVPAGGTAQIVADHIPTFSLQCFDANGMATNTGNDVRRIRVSVTGRADAPNRQTGKTYQYQLSSDFQLATRQ